MAFFSKPIPLHIKIATHPAFMWAQIGLVSLGALQTAGQVVSGTVQALMKDKDEDEYEYEDE